MKYSTRNPAAAQRADNLAAARQFIAANGREESRRTADAEVFRAVNDVTYPFGRVGLYQAIRDILNGDAA